MPELNLPTMNNTWANSSAANGAHGWDPNKLVVPGYDNGSSSTPKKRESQTPRDRVEINRPENSHSKDESAMQWLRSQLGF
jgi:hypothetical protein